VVRHIKLGWRKNVPLDALGRGLRRLSYVNTIDVTDNADYLILSWFDQIKDLARYLLTTKDLKDLNETVIESWRHKFDSRKCHLVIARRFDISAPGTSALAFYSANPIVGVDFWSVKGIEDQHAKVLSLWFNSTISLLQTLVVRTETRGAWMKIHDYMFKELLAPDVKGLKRKDYRKMLGISERTKSIRFPSILDQLKTEHPTRRLIDKAWLEILGYNGDVNKLLDKLYSSLAHEITILKKMMAEKI